MLIANHNEFLCKDALDSIGQHDVHGHEYGHVSCLQSEHVDPLRYVVLMIQKRICQQKVSGILKFLKTFFNSISNTKTNTANVDNVEFKFIYLLFIIICIDIFIYSIAVCY